jgi:ABC-type lipoprotein release transport system permease subunit
VVPEGWLEQRTNTLRLSRWEEVRDLLQACPEVEQVMPRARTNGLLAFGNRTAGVEIVGVVPDAEAAANRLVFRAQLTGRYLQPTDRNKAVIGRTLTRRLDVELGDDLYVTVAGKDEIRAAMLQIVGVLETGSRELDATICHVTLADVEAMTGYAGAGDISIMLRRQDRIPHVYRELRDRVGPGNVLVTWKQVSPALAAGMDGDRAFLTGLVGIVVLVVVLGIASAQLTAVLERRRELAVLSALGMRTRQLAAVIALEAVMIGVGGALVATVLGGSGAYWLATTGVDLSTFVGEELSFENILLDPRLYGSFGPWLLAYALAISISATIVASAYPAWRATRLDPAEALRM